MSTDAPISRRALGDLGVKGRAAVARLAILRWGGAKRACPSVERKLAAIAKLKVQEGYFSAPKIRALVETTISTGLRKAGVPEE